MIWSGLNKVLRGCLKMKIERQSFFVRKGQENSNKNPEGHLKKKAIKTLKSKHLIEKATSEKVAFLV